jgi:2-polyprenyl-6-methoxyphenol hydroxylase-like FAD-dependent oxidoreductase
MRQHSLAVTDADDGIAEAQHAIVIGGSMAGLLAARVLADHFARVTVVQRDRLPLEPELRSGVPQGRHVHVLLVRGQQILERRFPGLQAELAAAGAPTLNWTRDWAFFGHGRWSPRYPSDYAVCTCSRALLETTVRARLRASGTVQFLERHEVTGLLATPDQRRVRGVTLRARPDGASPGGATTALPAALVVDASGRESRAPDWLRALGYAPPAETTINALLGYASRWYRQSAAAGQDWHGMLINPRPPHQPRSGVIYPIEGDRWIVTLIGTAGAYPPTDEAAFLDFARALDHPALAEAIATAEPITPIAGYRRTENRLRHYAQLARMPDAFVVLGDAVCAFNPIYGQGMTVAALGAETLDAVLREQPATAGATTVVGRTQGFQRRLARVTATAWLMATGADLNWPTTVGGQVRRRDRLVQRYLDRVIRLTSEDAAANQVFIEVAHLLRPPASLFAPRIVAGVLRQALRGHGRRAADAVPPRATT